MNLEAKNEIFVVRRPIFDRHQNVYAYELRFRSMEDNYFTRISDYNCSGPDMLAECLEQLGLKEIKGNKRALLHLSGKSLLKSCVYQVTKDQLMVEPPANIDPAPQTINILKSLGNHGFTLVLDDFIFQEKYESLVPFADIIKLNYQALKEQGGMETAPVFYNARGKPVRLMAVNIDTQSDYHDAVDAGFTYFQGDFINQLVMVGKQDMAGNVTNLLRLLNEITSPAADLDKIENHMKRELDLTYAFLRFINSAAFGFVKEVRSIRHAVNLIGLPRFKQWFSLLLFGRVAMEKPEELFIQSVIRGKLCETIAHETSLADREGEAFLMGMFSLLDVLVGRDMDEVLSFLPLAQDIKNALLGRSNRFRHLLELVRRYEQGDWRQSAETAALIPFHISLLPALYFDAVNWTNQLERNI